MTSRALRSCGPNPDLSNASWDEFSAKLCASLQRVIATAVKEEVLTNLRSEFLRPVLREIATSGEAILGELSRTSSRTETELNRRVSLTEIHSEQRNLEKHTTEPCTGEKKRMPAVEASLAQIVEENQSTHAMLAKILQQHEENQSIHAMLAKIIQHHEDQADRHHQHHSMLSTLLRHHEDSKHLFAHHVQEGSQHHDERQAGHSPRSSRGEDGQNGNTTQSPSKVAAGSPGQTRADRVSVRKGKEDETSKRWHVARDRKLNKQLTKTNGFFTGRCRSGTVKPPDTILARLILSQSFSNLCLAVIVANSSFIGWEANIKIKCALSGTNSPAFLDYINRGFLIFFVVEMLLRIISLRLFWAVGADNYWNWFDAFLVGTSVIQEAFAGINVSFMRIFRVFRIVRVARVFRVVRFFSELRRMMLAIISCLASLGWAFLLILLIVYVFSIFLVQGCTGYILHTVPDDALVADLAYWYSTLPHTMFSLVLAISGGDDWWSMLEPLVSINEIYRLIFTAYVLFIIFGVLNVLTGVFTQSACDLQDKDLVIQEEMSRADHFVKEMQGFFNQSFDEGGEHMVNWEQFEVCMERDDVLAYLGSHQLDVTDAYTLFKLLDTDGQELVDVNEFIQGCLRLKGAARAIDTACMARDIGVISDCLQDLMDDVRT